MKTQFALDLRAARRKAGYLQSDVAHLLGAYQSTLSKLETGQRWPTLREIITLSLIYGRSFESLFGEIMGDARADLLKQLRSLPGDVPGRPDTFNRAASIRRLGERLQAELEENGEA